MVQCDKLVCVFGVSDQISRVAPPPPVILNFFVYKSLRILF